MKALIIAGLLFPLSAFLSLGADESIVINEIHYHPDIETERVEFIELFNAGDGAVDLSNWYFSEGIDHTFAEGERLEAGAYYVLAQDMEAYNRKFGSIFAGGVKANAQWNGGTLSNGGETLTLRSAAGEVVDEVTFQDEFPWPVSADGGGSSMELIPTDSGRFDRTPNHALQRTRPSRHCCNRGISRAGSLSLGRPQD